LKLTQQNALAGKLPRETDKSIVLEVKKRRNTLPENCFMLDISVAGADVRNCRGILEAETKNAKRCF
jgi:hypothetical protein